MRHWTKTLRNLSLLTQFGLSLIMPLLLCLFVCYLLTTKASFGSWIYLLGFFFGLGGSFTTAWKFYKYVTSNMDLADEKRKRKKENATGYISFNSHH